MMPFRARRRRRGNGTLVIPCVLWESNSRDERFAGSDYLSRDGAFEMGPTTVLNICTTRAKMDVHNAHKTQTGVSDFLLYED